MYDKELEKYLRTIKGIKVSFEKDMISLEDSYEPRAEMSCGHVISSESMLGLLQLIATKR